MNKFIKTRIKSACSQFARTSLFERLFTTSVQFPDCVRIVSPDDTLEHCRHLIETKSRGGYLRFGDGDVFLMTGRSDKFQASNDKLALEMRETFNLSGKGIMKGLGLHSKKFGMLPNMSPGMHELSDEVAVHLLANCYQYFIGTPIYSSIALPYLAVYDPSTAIDFLKFLKGQNPVLFIGNEQVPNDILTKLFGSIARVNTPSQNSYERIDHIADSSINSLSKQGASYGVVIIAMGCSGRPLAKRIYHSGANVFTFDFGSLLDAFCGWNTRTWIGMSEIDFSNVLNEIA